MSRKLWIGIGVLLAVIIAGAAAWSLRDDYARARIAASFAAKQACSCMHVSGRPLEACLADFPTDQAGRATITAEGSHVRARALFGAISAEAEYEDGYGCRLTD